ncbi:MAG: alpha/beta hydrolase [Alphaproteobacteria bacterium]|nr:alpha/beta hydrolase [Alphaproteobacteria bacterium]
MADGIIALRRTLERADGRKLGFAEYGDPAGLVVFGFHGVPGTRLMFRPTAAAAKRLGLRVIAPDRPGYGLSEPQPGRRLADWLDDMAAILKYLAIDTFSVVGISGGGPFATITAAHFGERVKALALVSPMGPVAEVYKSIDMPALQQRFFLKLPQRERVVNWGMGGANAIFRFAPGTSYDLAVRTLPPADREILQEKRMKAHVIEDVQESLSFDGVGARSDLVIFSAPWGVDYRQITARAILWQGLDDTIVPIGAALALGRLIPGCRIVELVGEGHFWGLKAVDEIMETVRRLATA